MWLLKYIYIGGLTFFFSLTAIGLNILITFLTQRLDLSISNDPKLG